MDEIVYRFTYKISGKPKPFKILFSSPGLRPLSYVKNRDVVLSQCIRLMRVSNCLIPRWRLLNTLSNLPPYPSAQTNVPVSRVNTYLSRVQSLALALRTSTVSPTDHQLEMRGCSQVLH